MLYDKNFLLQLDKVKHKVIYARITALTFQETPIEYIEGRVTQGSINLDGTSATRRSCSLTIVAQDFQYNDYYWGLNTKFKLEIGVENKIDPMYPDIIWFKQGIYLITNFNTSRSTNNFNISIQGKDKMCLLDGTVGGSLESSIDFGTIEEETQDGVWSIRKIPIPEIIKNIIHTYGGEPYHNIIINDLDTYGLELVEYCYDVPLYLYRKENEPIYINGFLKGDNVTVKDKNGTLTTLDQLDNSYFESLTVTLTDNVYSPLVEVINDLNEIEKYHIAKIEMGQTAGYKRTELVYDGDLIANVGESIVSVLDKIKNMLTEFEYFYNLEGQFVFQKKQCVKESIWQFDDEKAFEQIAQSNSLSTTRAYEFYGSEFISAFNNNPNLLNMRNDYSIWGERDGISGAKIPVHLRYAIDKKPKSYTTITVSGDEDEKALQNYNQKYQTNISTQTARTYSTQDYDWREIIYQMALDYYKYNFLDDFELKVAAANPELYPTGRTGYEQYYIDLQGFWRELYCPVEELERIDSIYENNYDNIQDLKNYLFNENTGLEKRLTLFNNATDQQRMSYIYGWTDYNFTYDNGNKVTDIVTYQNMLNDMYFRLKNQLNTRQESYTSLGDKYQYANVNEYYTEGDNKYWNRKVYETPEQLNFWFDFLDSTGELSQFSVQSVGDRPKAINDTKIKSIYFRDTPSVIYIAPGETESNLSGFRYIKTPDLDHMFLKSGQGKSAKNKLSELLYQHSYCIESVTITTIPIYYLEPNTRIYLHDEETGLDGEYIISKLSLSLSYNGTMSITATKAAENIL